jgi:cytohesin
MPLVAQADRDLLEALHAGIAKRDLARVQQALASGADPNAAFRGRRPLDELRFPSEVHRRIVDVLLDAGARLEETRYAPPLGLVTAAADAQPRIVEQLLAQDVDVDHVGILPHTQVGMKRFTPLQAAIYVSGVSDHYDPHSRQAYRDVVLRLLEAGADPMANVREDTTLHHAAAACDAEVIEALLRAGAEPNARERHHERTPLFTAVDGLCPEAVGPLVAAGAEPDAEDASRRTPLSYLLRKAVIAREHVEITRALLAAGAQMPPDLDALRLDANKNRLAGAELLALLEAADPGPAARAH